MCLSHFVREVNGCWEKIDNDIVGGNLLKRFFRALKERLPENNVWKVEPMAYSSGAGQQDITEESEQPQSSVKPLKQIVYLFLCRGTLVCSGSFTSAVTLV
ncbi:hypothetical protein Tco_0172605 [Tanacetum coccineum]